MARLVRRHPLVAFFVLAYALSWGGWPLHVAFGWPLPFLPAGPLLAALVVAVTAGRPGLRTLGARLVHWRVGWRWYAVALGLPALVFLGTAALLAALGAPAPAPARLGPLSGLLLVFALRLIDPLEGPLGEEPGWRGYALPALQAGRSPLGATLILGGLAAGWHLPLAFLERGVTPMDFLQPFAFAFVCTWLFNRTGGSALLPFLLHVAEGTVQSGALWAAGAGAELAQAIYPIVWGAAAVAVVVFDRGAWQPARGEALPGLTPAPAVVAGT